MRTFEIILKECMDAVEKVKADKELSAAIANAKEITIDVYGNAEFREAAEVAGCLQELAPTDADVIFRVVPESVSEAEVKMVLTISE